MIDAQKVIDGVGSLRLRHNGGSEGMLSDVHLEYLVDYRTVGKSGYSRFAMILTLDLDGGGTLKAPQTAFEEVVR